jgi:hypothetical protein
MSAGWIAVGERIRDSEAAANTDRELWREREGDFYADSIHVTAQGSIGINVGGLVIVMPLKEWHQAALVSGKALLAAGKLTGGPLEPMPKEEWKDRPEIVDDAGTTCVLADKCRCFTEPDLATRDGRISRCGNSRPARWFKP